MPPTRDQPNILRGPGDYDVTKDIHNDTYPAISPLNANFTGKSVFVSGGSKGLGRAMALSYAKAGASQIAVGARSDMSQLKKDIEAAATGAKRSPPEFLPVTFDVTDQKSVEAAAEQVGKAFGGKLDVLINSAGILGSYNLIKDSDPDQWWNVMNVNLRGPYLVTRSFLPLLLKGESKYLVNIVSVGAHLLNPTVSHYQISKLAQLRLAQLTNVEHAEQGLISFAIHPGNVPTDIMGGPEALPEHHKHVFVETPELSGDSVVYLTSERREWIGGRYINVTWDLPELMSQKDRIVKDDKLKVKLDF